MHRLFLALGLLGFTSFPNVEATIVPGSTDLGNIWFIGDSITESNADGDSAGSPRLSLYNLLTVAGNTFTFTGHHTRTPGALPVTGGTPTTNLYQYHSGFSGAVIGNDVTPSDGFKRSGITQNLPTWWTQGRLAVAKPNVILIMIGTNNVALDVQKDEGQTLLTNLLNTIYGLPGIGTPTIFLASIPPSKYTPTSVADVNAFNAVVPTSCKTSPLSERIFILSISSRI
jgi:hypothetical protein